MLPVKKERPAREAWAGIRVVSETMSSSSGDRLVPVLSARRSAAVRRPH